MNSSIITTAPNQYQIMLDNYAGIVEKTNQQLSVWSNPYGVMIGVLTLIIAIVAVAVSIYIWKNSKEQKDLYLQTIESHKKQIEDRYDLLIEEKTLDFKKVISDFNQLVGATKEDNKEKVEKIVKEYKDKISDLEKQKSSVINFEPARVFYDDTLNVNSVFSFGKPQPEIHKMFCAQCGKSFEYYEESKDPWSIDYVSTATRVSNYGYSGSNKKVHCSHCNAINVPK